MTTKTRITLGSLFDGIGGFPYAGTFFGIQPVWASEILPSAVSVTRRHLPGMAHVGDITQLHGGELPTVDIITFGSPCQDLSFAGKRAGLAGERSGLFMEAIRIIREMREATNGRYPRYALWENVPGALSSGKPAGSDFRAVLEAFTETEIPVPRSGRWANAGMVRGHGADLAWCVYNAQHFGTAQRRRRIFLVVDFAGGCAGEILFVPHSLRGYFAQGGTPRQGPAAYAAGGPAGENRQPTPDNCLTPWDVQSRRIHSAEGTWPALYGGEGGGRGYCLNPWDTQQSRVTTGDGVSPTLAGADGGGGRNPAGLVLTAAFFGKAGAKARSIGYGEERCPTLTSNTPSVVCLNDQGGDSISVEKGEQAPTLRSETHGNLPVICRATALANAETLEEKSATLTCYHEQPIICKAVHQNQEGGVSTSDTAYTLSTASNASARNAPLVMTETYAINATAIGRQPLGGGNGLGIQKEVSPTLTSADRHAVCRRDSAEKAGNDAGHPFPFVFESHGQDARYTGPHKVAPAVTASYGMGGGNIPLTCSIPADSGAVHPDVSGTLCASGAGLSRPGGMKSETDLCVAYSLQGNMIGRQEENGPEGAGVNTGVSFTLNTRDRHGVCAAVSSPLGEQGGTRGDSVPPVECAATEQSGVACNSRRNYAHSYMVRRLTPTECERLQGYPDGWTAFDETGKPISDSKRYQMLGNSIAVPCAAYILGPMAEQLGKGD